MRNDGSNIGEGPGFTVIHDGSVHVRAFIISKYLQLIPDKLGPLFSRVGGGNVDYIWVNMAMCPNIDNITSSF